MPALVVLSDFRFRWSAVGRDAAILFANGALPAMLGYTPEALRSLRFHQIFGTLPVEESDAVSILRSDAERVVELAHVDGSTVLAWMTNSALLRRDDKVALATFHDLTERLWLDGR